MAAIAMMTAMSTMAQKIEVVDADGNGIPLVCVLTEDGNLIGRCKGSRTGGRHPCGL